MGRLRPAPSPTSAAPAGVAVGDPTTHARIRAFAAGLQRILQSLLGLLLVASTTACSAPHAQSAQALEPSCASCHAAPTDAHAASRHARAARSEVFVALRAEAEATWRAAAFCDGCHLPVGAGPDGLGCLTCHASAGNLGRGDGALLFAPDQPVTAARASGRAPHAVSETGFVASADLCGTCHDVDGPGPFRETPFEHWQRSPAAERKQPCQTCHMPRVDGQTSHRPVGLVGGDDDEVQALLSSALSLELVSVGPHPEGREIGVRLTSRNDGHHVPDGASFLRELWLDAAVGGWRSAVAAEGEGVRGDPRWLSARLFSGDVEVALPTAADRAEPRGLAPRERREERFVVPDDGPARICVRFRRYRGDMLRALGLSPSLAGPTLEITCVEVL